MAKIVTMMAVLIASVSLTANAADLSYFDVIAGVTHNAAEIDAAGKIQAIDLENRTIVVSGFRYYVPPANALSQMQVKLLGVQYGAFELIRKDMLVEVKYLPTSTFRVATTMTQVTHIVQD